MQCPKCNNETDQTKAIVSKKPETCGNAYTVFVCQSGCRDKSGKYAFTFFPPKNNGNAPTQKADGKAVDILSVMSETLLRIETILANPNQVHIAEAELQPDEETPF